MPRGSRPVPAGMSLARDLLSALEHAHARNIIIRRIVPTTLMLDVSGRGVVTDVRHANTCMAFEATETTQTATPFCAPEVRAGGVGEPASDVYAVAANLYYALTGQEPAADGATLRPPRKLRAAVPAAVERVLLRALRPKPGDRSHTATQMPHDPAVDAPRSHHPPPPPH